MAVTDQHPNLADPLPLELEGLPGWPGPPVPPLTLLPALRARVPGTGGGRPGASSKAAYRRRRQAEWRAWRASLRWRMAVAAAVGALVAGPRLAWSNGLAAAAGVALTLRFRPSAATRACLQGARGERRTARLLAPLEREGSVILHDLAPLDGAIPEPGQVGQPQPPNLDHLVIGPSGVFLVASRAGRGRLRVDARGRLWQRDEPLDGVLEALRRSAREATVALADGHAPARVQPMLAVHGAGLPWLGELLVGGVPVLEAADLPRALRVPRQALTPEQVAHLAARARATFRPAPAS